MGAHSGARTGCRARSLPSHRLPTTRLAAVGALTLSLAITAWAPHANAAGRLTVPPPKALASMRTEVRPIPKQRDAGPAPQLVYAIGDSVMLGAQPCLEHLGYRVNAQGSRSARAGLLELTRAAEAGELPPWVVIHLGTNGGVTMEQLDDLLAVVGPGRHVVLMTVQLPDDPARFTFELSSNVALQSSARRYPDVRIADWHAVSDRYPGMVWSEGIHLTPLGCWTYAELVRSALQAPAGSLVPAGRASERSAAPAASAAAASAAAKSRSG